MGHGRGRRSQAVLSPSEGTARALVEELGTATATAVQARCRHRRRESRRSLSYFNITRYDENGPKPQPLTGKRLLSGPHTASPSAATSGSFLGGGFWMACDDRLQRRARPPPAGGLRSGHARQEPASMPSMETSTCSRGWRWQEPSLQDGELLRSGRCRGTGSRSRRREPQRPTFSPALTAWKSACRMSRRTKKRTKTRCA